MPRKIRCISKDAFADSLDCWSIAEGSLQPDGWRPMHFADKPLPASEKHPYVTLICFEVDADGLPGTKRYLLRHWWRRMT